MDKQALENKQNKTQEMANKVLELETAQDKVAEVVDKLEDAKGKDAEAIVELQEQLEQIDQDKLEATDVTSAKKLIKKAKDIQEEIELTKGVNQARAKQRTQELEDVAEELFSAHKKTDFLYKSLETTYKKTVSVNSLQEDNELLADFAKTINNAFAYTRSVLIDFEIVSRSDANRQYKGIHLGQRSLHTDLKRLFNPEQLRQLTQIVR